MHTQHSNAHPVNPAARKAELLRDGEFYRAGVAHARAQIKHGSRPEVLFHSAIDHATWALRSRADALLKPTGTSITTLAPYAMTALSFIRKRRLGKPALAVAALLGVAGWYVQRKRAKDQLAY
jgi:C4-dicarboxylate-specific signal transduction histidine kinase